MPFFTVAACHHLYACAVVERGAPHNPPPRAWHAARGRARAGEHTRPSPPVLRCRPAPRYELRRLVTRNQLLIVRSRRVTSKLGGPEAAKRLERCNRMPAAATPLCRVRTCMQPCCQAYRVEHCTVVGSTRGCHEMPAVVLTAEQRRVVGRWFGPFACRGTAVSVARIRSHTQCVVVSAEKRSVLPQAQQCGAPVCSASSVAPRQRRSV